MSSYTTFNANTGNTNTTANFLGLDNGKYYQFRVSAINSEGSGVVSLSDKALLSGPPNAVTSLTPTIGANSVSLSWTKPSSSGGKLITGYKIESKLYAETVSDALASVSATAGNGECVVSWVAPTNVGYSDITGYKVEYAVSPYNTWSVATASVNSLTYTVTGLTNGTSYKFRVSVINGGGTSSPTESSIATPQAVPPGPPTNVSGTVADAVSLVSWTAPTNDGGADITGYDLMYAPGLLYDSFTTVELGNITSYTVLSLSNGTSYKFKVSAKNTAGTGTASVLSSAVTPTDVFVKNGNTYSVQNLDEGSSGFSGTKYSRNTNDCSEVTVSGVQFLQLTPDSNHSSGIIKYSINGYTRLFVSLDLFVGNKSGADAFFFTWGSTTALSNGYNWREDANYGGYMLAWDIYGTDQIRLSWQNGTLSNVNLSPTDNGWTKLSIEWRNNTITVWNSVSTFDSNTQILQYTDYARTLNSSSYISFAARTGSQKSMFGIRDMKVWTSS